MAACLAPETREFLLFRLFEFLVPTEARDATQRPACQGLVLRHKLNEYSWCRVLGRLTATANHGVAGLRVRLYLQRAAFRYAAKLAHDAKQEIRNRTLGERTCDGLGRLWLGPSEAIGEAWETINKYTDNESDGSDAESLAGASDLHMMD